MREINLADFLLQSPITYRGHKGKDIFKKPVYGLDRHWKLSADAGCIYFKDTHLYYSDGSFSFKTDTGDAYIIMLDKIDHVYELLPREKVRLTNGSTFCGDYTFLITTTDNKEIFIGK